MKSTVLEFGVCSYIFLLALQRWVYHVRVKVDTCCFSISCFSIFADFSVFFRVRGLNRCWLNLVYIFIDLIIKPIYQHF